MTDDNYRGCSRAVVSDGGLWYSVAPVGLSCCVLLNNPNPLRPPWLTSVLLIAPCIFYYAILHFHNLVHGTLMVCVCVCWRGGKKTVEQVPHAALLRSLRLPGPASNPWRRECLLPIWNNNSLRTNYSMVNWLWKAVLMWIHNHYVFVKVRLFVCVSSLPPDVQVTEDRYKRCTPKWNASAWKAS